MLLSLGLTSALPAQPLSSWPVPVSLPSPSWRAQLFQGIVFLSSSHSNWLYAYTSQGRLLWKLSLNWPLSSPLASYQGLLLIQQEGQLSLLLQPETGELRNYQPRWAPGWCTARDSQNWLRLSPAGQLFRGSPNWTEWNPWLQLRLARGDRWLGPPVAGPAGIFLGSAQGQLLQVDWEGGQQRPLPSLARPLLAPQPYAGGFVSLSLDGLLLAQPSQGARWLSQFPGGAQCYSQRGQLLSLPQQDAQGNLYLTTRQQLLCWDLQGRLRWRRPGQYLAPSLWEGSEGLALTSQGLLRLEAGSGRLLQRWPLRAAPISPLSSEKSLIALVVEQGWVQIYQRDPKISSTIP